MKMKTSITLSEDILGSLEEVAKDYKNRSKVIEEALREFLQRRVRDLRDDKDLKILNRKSEDLNEEAEDVLSYQAEL